MQIFRSEESHSHKIVPKIRKELGPEIKDEQHPFLYIRGLIIYYKKERLHLIFNIPEALTGFTSVSVDFKNLSTNETISVSQDKKQKVILDPEQRYRIEFIGSLNCVSPNINSNSQIKYIYEIEPEPKPVS